MTKAGERLIGAAEEALAIAKGEAPPESYRIFAPRTVDVRAIRQKLGMTQALFGERFGFGVARVRDWEQGRTKPDAANTAFLHVICKRPEMVAMALAEDA